MIERLKKGNSMYKWISFKYIPVIEELFLLSSSFISKYIFFSNNFFKIQYLTYDMVINCDDDRCFFCSY